MKWYCNILVVFVCGGCLQVAVQDGRDEGAAVHRGEAPAARAERSRLRDGQSFPETPTAFSQMLVLINLLWDSVLVYRWRGKWMNSIQAWLFDKTMKRWKPVEAEREVGEKRGRLHKGHLFQSS